MREFLSGFGESERMNGIHKDMKTVAIIPGAGTGERMGPGRAKQFMELEGRPILALTLEKFQACPVIDGIVLVVPLEDIEFCEREIVEKYDLNKVKRLIAGGERRQDSVRFGIEASAGEYGLVLIHDGVRPFIPAGLIEEVVSAARTHPAVITALPVRETLKEVEEDGSVIKSLDRRRIRAVQTPQAFRYEDIMRAHQKAREESWEEATDDAMMVERMGIPVKVVVGSEYNIKITTPHDLEIARFLFERTMG
jgi:2-C-methyl-D-erythritol 4-phosphate cytidylyltransferase